jgi:hypothetical protein
MNTTFAIENITNEIDAELGMLRELADLEVVLIGGGEVLIAGN